MQPSVATFTGTLLTHLDLRDRKNPNSQLLLSGAHARSKSSSEDDIRLA